MNEMASENTSKGDAPDKNTVFTAAIILTILVCSIIFGIVLFSMRKPADGNSLDKSTFGIGEATENADALQNANSLQPVTQLGQQAQQQQVRQMPPQVQGKTTSVPNTNTPTQAAVSNTLTPSPTQLPTPTTTPSPSVTNTPIPTEIFTVTPMQ